MHLRHSSAKHRSWVDAVITSLSLQEITSKRQIIARIVKILMLCFLLQTTTLCEILYSTISWTDDIQIFDLLFAFFKKQKNCEIVKKFNQYGTQCVLAVLIFIFWYFWYKSILKVFTTPTFEINSPPEKFINPHWFLQKFWVLKFHLWGWNTHTCYSVGL